MLLLLSFVCSNNSLFAINFVLGDRSFWNFNTLMPSTELVLGLTLLDSCSTRFKQIGCTSYKFRDCAKSDWFPKFSILITCFFFRSLMKIPKLFFKNFWPSSYGIIDKSGQRNQHQKLLCGFSNIFVIVLAILKGTST
jgi:hypothetical protein